jgi:hypothetical protein
MVPAMDLVKFEVGDRSVTGIKEASQNSSVYRNDIIGIENREAKLIAEAPETATERDRLAAENERLREALEVVRRSGAYHHLTGETKVLIDAALSPEASQ